MGAGAILPLAWAITQIRCALNQLAGTSQLCPDVPASPSYWLWHHQKTQKGRIVEQKVSGGLHTQPVSIQDLLGLGVRRFRKQLASNQHPLISDVPANLIKFGITQQPTCGIIVYIAILPAALDCLKSNFCAQQHIKYTAEFFRVVSPRSQAAATA